MRDLLVEELPDFLQETAFLDRIKGIIPGWQTQKLNSRAFADSLGLKADFFGDALLALRDDLSADQYTARRVELVGERPYKRNHDSVRSIASGMMKILFPDGDVSDSDFSEVLSRSCNQNAPTCVGPALQLGREYRQYEKAIKCRLI